MRLSPHVHFLRPGRFACRILIVFCCLLCLDPALAATDQDDLIVSPGQKYRLEAAIQRGMQSREDHVYTVTGNDNRTVTPDSSWYGIVDKAPLSSSTSPDVIIGPGTVTLTGENGQSLFNVPVASGNNSKIRLQTTGDAAILRLEQGEATGTLGVGVYANRTYHYDWRDALLYIGAGQSGEELPTVTINGSINGIGRTIIEGTSAESLLETQGANLVVKGNISANQSSTMLRTLNAYNGSIETDAGGAAVSTPSHFDIYAYNVNLKSGNHVSAAVDFTASAVNIPDNAYIYAGNRLDVIDTIGGNGGSMSLGSTLEAGKMVVLRGGLTKGAGLIKTITRSILSHIPADAINVELPLFPITQGGDVPLVLDAGQDILPGETDVDKMHADRDIVAGSISSVQGTNDDYYGALPGRYCLNAGGDAFTYPRATITANTIEAGGRLLAGELNMPRGSTDNNSQASLTAGNIWITSSAPAENGFEKASGNFTLDNGSFTLKNASNLVVQEGLENTHTVDHQFDYASIIDGDMTVTRNTDSSFTTLNVGGSAKIEHGTLKGALLKANAATFDQIKSVNISDTLDVAKDFTATANGNSEVTTTSVGGVATVDGGSYSGKDFTAASAAFNNISDITMTGKLKSTSGDSGDISVSQSGQARLASTEAARNFTLSGGSYMGDSLTTGADAKLGDTSAINLARATIGGALESVNNKVATISQLKTGGGVTVQGGVFKSSSVTTGTDAAQTGDFKSTDANYDLGDGSFIRGSLLAENSTGTFANLTVNDVVEISGGYFDGNALNTTSGVFKNKSTAYIDELVLNGTGLSLEIEEGSHVIVQKISDATGTELISQGGLVILGDPADPDSWDTLGDINLSSGSITATKSRIRTGDIYGRGKGNLADDIKTHQLRARTIDISNANLQLTGLRDFASRVDENLIIDQNGDTALGDISVGGLVDISGGTVTARQLVSGEEATFTGVGLNLAGTGASASHIGGDLALNDNAASSLGDITVTGGLTANGGSLAANILNVEKTASLKDLSLTLADEQQARGSIGGDLEITGNGASSLGYLHVGDNMSITGGNLIAQSLDIGKNADLTGVRATLQGTIENPGIIGGSLSLTANEDSSLGSLKVGADFSATGGKLEAGTLKVDGKATFTDISPVLTGTAQNPGSIGQNLELAGQTDAHLGYLEVTGQSLAKDNSLEAASLTTGSASFANATAKFSQITVRQDGDFQKGTFDATKMTADKALFHDGINALLEEMYLARPESSLLLGQETDSVANATVNIGKLDLNSGSLNVGNGSGLPVIMTVGAFSHESSAHVNGNIGVSENGRLVLGSRDQAWLPASLDGARAVLGLAQPMTLGRGYGLHVTGNGLASPQANQIRFDSGSLLVINGATSRVYYQGSWIPTTQLADGNGAVGALSAEAPTISALIAQGARIQILNPVPNSVVVALGQNIQTRYLDAAIPANARADTDNPWTGANLIYDNSQVRIERLDGDYAGQFSVKPLVDPTPPDQPTPPDNPPDQPGPPDNPPDQPGPPDNPPDQPGPPDNPPDQPGRPDNPQQPIVPKPENTHPGADPGIHELIKNEGGKGHVGTQEHHLHKDDGAGFISHTMAHDKPQEATHITEGSSRMIILGAVPQLLLTANTAGEAAMAARLDGLLWREDDLHARSVALWAVPLYKTSTAWTLEAGAHDYDYNGGIGGIAIGGDISFGNRMRAGLSFNIGAGYSKSGGDLPETTNNMNFWGIGAYAGGLFHNLGISADLHFTSSYNKLKQDVSALNGWKELKTDARAYALGAGLDLEYLFRMEHLDFVPHAGLKYHYLHVDDYDIEHQGKTIIKGKNFDQNIWTFPVGLRFESGLSTENGWHVRPGIDLRFTPAAGDIKARTKTRYTGTDAELELQTKVMDYMSWGGSAFIEASYHDFSLGLNYSVDVGSHTLSNAIYGTLRYEF